jgi:hypothetical protein
MKSDVAIRKAERQDVPLLLEFIRGIARYEKMEDEVITSADVLWDIRDRRVSFPPVDYVLELIPLSS